MVGVVDKVQPDNEGGRTHTRTHTFMRTNPATLKLTGDTTRRLGNDFFNFFGALAG